MTRMRFIIPLLPLFVGFAPAAHADAPSPPPNVIFISIDDMNDWMGAMNHQPDKSNPQIQTPHLDRLADEGMLFLDAHVQGNRCDPSRASFMSGYSMRTFLTGGSQDKVKVRTTELGGTLLDEWFHDNGYQVYTIGKVYHTGRSDVAQFGGPGLPEDEPRPPKPEEPFKWDEKGTGTDWGVWPERTTQMGSHHTASIVINWLRDHETDTQGPFFMMVGFTDPHVPWYASQEWFDLYPIDDPDNPLWLPPFKADDLDDLPGSAPDPLSWSPRMSDGFWEEIVQAYSACISVTDYQVGRILDELAVSPYADNTIVVVQSDHGYHMGEKDRFQKHTQWERTTHVPFIFAGPGVPEGAVSDRVVSLLDMYPTLVELCGLPENPETEGVSLVPLFEDPDREWDHPSFITTGSTIGMTTEDWKIIRYNDQNVELYDRVNDPNEWHNLAGDPDYADIKQALLDRLPPVYSNYFSPSVSGSGKFIHRTPPPDFARVDGQYVYSEQLGWKMGAVPDWGHVFTGWTGVNGGTPFKQMEGNASLNEATIEPYWNVKKATADFEPGAASYGSWEHYSSAAVDKTADNDGDGYSNLAEYLLRMDPEVADAPPDGGAPVLETPRMEFAFRLKSDDPNASYRVEVSEDLKTWHYNGDGSGETWTETNRAEWHHEDNSTSYRVKASGPLAGNAVFYRLRFDYD